MARISSHFKCSSAVISICFFCLWCAVLICTPVPLFILVLASVLLCSFSSQVIGHKVYFLCYILTIFLVVPPMSFTRPFVWSVICCSVYIVVLCQVGLILSLLQSLFGACCFLVIVYFPGLVELVQVLSRAICSNAFGRAMNEWWW